MSPSADNWPLIPIHAALTPDGRVLTYGTDGTGRQTAFFIYDVWDPAAGLAGGHLTLNNMTLTDIFCSSQVILPQSGSIFIAGGDNWTGTSTTNTGNSNSNVFEYTSNSLSRTTEMNRSRWYSSSTVLTNGEIYIQGGSGGEDRPEVRELDGDFRLLSNVNTNAMQSLFPRNFLAPDGRVFGYDTNGVMHYVNANGTGTRTAAGTFSSNNAGFASSAAMFRPGRILQMGGNSNGAIVIDINGASPTVTPTQSMATQRQWVSATVLADGRVLATGGSAVDNQLTNVNNSAAVWNPATGTWTIGPNGLRARLYHSIGLLLPDASVLVGGGGAPGPLVNRHVEIYYPSYLYNASGTFAARPQIVTAPDTLQIGQGFTMGVGSADIRRVTLVKTGSVTHSVNMDQRFIELSFTASSGTLFVQAPTAQEAPPGYYLMFAFNETGVPSVGKIVRINIGGDTTAPGAPGAVTASAVSANQINLSWGVATDNVGVTGYQVESCQGAACSNFALVTTVTGTTFNNTGLSPSTTYRYRVRATDAAGNLGAYTAVASATTPTGPPPPATAIRVNVGGPAYTDTAGKVWSADTGFNTGNALSWPTNLAIAGTSDPVLYRTERWDAPSAPAMTYSFTVPNGSYQVRLHFAENYAPLFGVGQRVFDVQVEGTLAIDNLDIFAQAGANTALIRTVTATVSDGQINIAFIHGVEDPVVDAIEVLGGTPDTTPPGVPGAVTASAVSASQVNLSWGAATDNIAVTGYQVERCQGATCTIFALITTVTGTSYNNTGLAASTTYRYRVRATDGAGNFGPYTSIVNATTQTPPPPDTTPPGAPGAVTASVVSASQINLGWGAATDNVGVTGYQVERCLGAACSNFGLLTTVTGTTFNNTGLAASTTYRYRVRATDAAGNFGTYTAIATATTQAPPATAIRVNVGGPAYTDTAANVWSADTGFNTGSALSWPTNLAIAGTSDPVLYRTERWDAPSAPAMTYSFTVPNGSYEVRLHFAENYSALFGVGQRVFDVQVEGALAIDNLDIFAQVGANTALIRTMTATVNDGQINIAFIHGVEDPVVDAIEVLTAAPAQPPLVLDPMPLQPARQANSPVSFTATSHNGINTQYKWYFDDGSETGWSTSPSVTHTYTQATIYWVSVTAKDDRNIELTQTFSQLIHLPLTTRRPTISSNLALGGGRVWVVNQDNDTVSAFNASTRQKLAEINVGTAPRTVAIAPNGEVWVTNRQSASISVIDPTTMTVNRTIALPYASRPFGIVFAPDGLAAYVALEGSGRVLRLDPNSGSELAGASVGPSPRHLSVNADGGRLYVSRFITPRLPGENTAVVATEVNGVKLGGEVLVLDTGTMGVLNIAVLQHSDDLDFENAGSGVPNYLGATVISPDGTSAWVPSKKDNIKRGTLRSGGNLNHQNTVRAVSSRIDLATSSETYGLRIDHDNASLASAAAFDRYGVFLFVALETSREVAVVDAHNGVEFFRINVGRAPQGVAVSADGYQLFVSNFMDRTVGVYNLTKLVDEGQWQAPLLGTLQSVAVEKLAPTVLTGKQFFYDARDTRVAREGYMSCASCHNDGGSDGRVWDLTGLGEGLRNTVALNGRAGAQGFLHWSGNFDEVQDFEGQIRALAGGTGLMSDAAFNQGTRSQPLGDPKAGLSSDLDALAAYLASLDTFSASPYRAAGGGLTVDGTAGKAIFQNLNCAQCHRGAGFTESGAATLRNIGTIQQPTSGKRLGAVLTGIDTPTLRDVWSSAPYLHDGSAATLADAVRAHNGVTVSDGDLTKLVAYLNQIDGQEPTPASTNGAPVVTNPGNRTGTVGTPVSLQIVASDPNADPLTFSASGLPAGLSISATGLISGSPTAVGGHAVSVQASDGQALGSTSFIWTINSPAPPDTTPPGAPGAVTASVVSTSQINLSWGAATDNVGVAGYQVERCQGAACANFALVATVTGTTHNNTGLTASTTYRYRVRATDAAGNFGPYTSIVNATTQTAPDTTPPGAPGTVTASVVSANQINLSWGAATDNVGVTGYQVERCQGAACANFALLATVTGTTHNNTGLTASTTYRYRVRATDAAGNFGSYTAVVNATTQAPPTTAIRVNVGGPAYTDTAANVWSADTGFNTGNALSWPTNLAIAGTSDPVLYRTERWDAPSAPAMTYSFTVPNGNYQVRLHFAENYAPLFGVGQRVFDVQVEGALAIDNLDIFAQVGANTALIRTVTATVSDGQINIVFIHGVEDPEVNAIEILSTGP